MISTGKHIINFVLALIYLMSLFKHTYSEEKTWRRNDTPSVDNVFNLFAPNRFNSGNRTLMRGRSR